MLHIYPLLSLNTWITLAMCHWLQTLSSCNTKTISPKKKLYGPFLWMGFNCLKATATSRRQFTFYHSVPRNSWYSFYQPRKDGRLSWPWSHPVVLNTGPLDWESSALTTWPLLHQHWNFFFLLAILYMTEVIEDTIFSNMTRIHWLSVEHDTMFSDSLSQV